MKKKTLNSIFSHLKVIELSSVLAGPSVGLFFAELGAKVIKIENKKNNGDVTRSWKLSSENSKENTSAYYWSVNTGKQNLFLDLTKPTELKQLYDIIKTADVLIANFKTGDDKKLKLDFRTLQKINQQLIYASITGYGTKNDRIAYDLILQAETGFMSLNGEANSRPLKLPIAFIDLFAAHQLKEAILIAMLQQSKTKKGSYITVSLFDAAIASLANQATNWLVAKQLPKAIGSLHPNIAPYGEIFTTKDKQQITFAIGTDTQFKIFLNVLKLPRLIQNSLYISNQLRVKNREVLFLELDQKIKTLNFTTLYNNCIKHNVPIGKIRNLKEVFELPMAKKMITKTKYKDKILNTVKSVAFNFENTI